MAVTFFCSTCAAQIQVDESMKGRFVVCGNCRMQVHVPDIVVAPPISTPSPTKVQAAEDRDVFEDLDENEAKEPDEPPTYRPRRRRRRRSQSSLFLPLVLAVIGIAAFSFVLYLLASTDSGEQARNSTGRAIDAVGGVVCVLAFLIPAYFFPSLVAYARGHHQRAAILVLNLFTAWTFVAWVICIVWAFTSIESREHVHYHYNR